MPAAGNRPAEWDKLLALLDEKLQLGLLEHLRRVTTYHIEGEVLFIVPASKVDYDYLNKPAVLQQLSIFAEDACAVRQVKVKQAE